MSFIKIRNTARFEAPNNPDPKLTPCLYRYEELSLGRGLLADGLADVDIDRHGDWQVLRIFPRGEEASGGIDDTIWTKSDLDRALFKLIAEKLREHCAADIEESCLAAGER